MKKILLVSILKNSKTWTLILLSIPVIISLFSYFGFFTYETYRIGLLRVGFWGLNRTERPASIAPDLLTMIPAILLYTSIIIRFRIRIFFDVYETLVSALIILFCASFISIFVGGTINILFLGEMSTTLVLWIAIIFSWIGIRPIACFTWVLLFILSIFRLSNVNEALGIWGAVYVLFAFLGVALYVKDFFHYASKFKSDFMGMTSITEQDLLLSDNTPDEE